MDNIVENRYENVDNYDIWWITHENTDNFWDNFRSQFYLTSC
jgi:hypothetical protein